MNGSPAAVLRLAAVFLVLGAGTIAATWWGSGDEATAALQLPYVIVALGIGVGCLVVASLLYVVARIRWVQRLTEAAVTRPGDGGSS
jgi:hypothetical protein